MAVIDNGLPPPLPLDDAAKAEWDEWVATRPPVVRALCEKFPPWLYYDMPETGQVVIVQAYDENGTMRVLMVGDRVSVPAIMQYEVFGVPPEDLVTSKKYNTDA